jgi:MscS family membrane protein
MNFQELINDWFGPNTYWDQNGAVVIQVFAVVVVTLLGAYLLKKIIDKLETKTQTTKTLWDDALIGALQKPVRVLVWLLGISLAAKIALRGNNPEILNIVNTIRTLGLAAIIAWFLVLFIKRTEQNLMDPSYTANKPMDETSVRAIGKLLRISVIITAALVGLESVGYSISGVLAFGGIGGLAVGFAAKDLLANFFGGLMVYLDRQFAVGDWIRSPDQNIEGTVEDIGWRLTRIRTFDKRPLYVPNSTFTYISVENPSRMTNRRIYETVGVRYDDAAKLPAIVAEVKTMLEKHDAIDHNQTLMVNFNAFASSSLDFFIYTFTKTTVWTEYHQIKQDVLFKILEIIEFHGAECAFPTSTIHVPDGLQLHADSANSQSAQAG